MLRYGLSVALLSVGGMALSAQARADDTSENKATASLVKAFVSLCVQSMPNLDQLETSAAAKGWKKFEGGDGIRFAAPAPNAKSTTWTVQGEADVPFWLSVTHGTQAGKKISACTIITASEPAKGVKSELVDTLDLKYPIQNEQRGDQQETYWNTTFEAISLVVSLSVPISPSATGFNLSATSIQSVP